MKELAPSEIATIISAFPCANMVITGGEPLMQQQGWVEVMSTLRAQNAQFRFEVETNGTLQPTPEFDVYIAQYNVSPKLSHSGNSTSLREKPEVLAYFAAHERAFFKFVVETPEDLEEVLALVARYNIAHDSVYLMPEGTKQEILKSRQQWVVEICKQYGFLYTDRLHIHIYGDKRGV